MLQTTQILNDRYQLQQLIGENASRQTWLANDVNDQRAVVVKLLAFSPTMIWEELKLFEREAQTLQRLNHPYIPKYLDYFYLDHLPDSRFSWFGLVQSHIAGKSLQQLLDENHHFSVDQVEQIATETLNILTYLHNLQPSILHRDIKPSNMIWGDNKHIYLVDFGSVQDSAALEGMTFTVVGTYGYVPMEQFGGRAEPASDLYAFGATLIHLLTGIPPAELPQQDARLQFADRVSLDLGLVNWLSQLVEPQLSNRLRTAEIALTKLKDRDLLGAPLNMNQPGGCRVQVHQSADELRVRIPARGRKALNPRYLIGATSYVMFIFSMQLGSMIKTLFPNPNRDAYDLYTLRVGLWDLHLLLISLTTFVFVLLLFVYLGLPILKQTTLYFNRHNFEIRWQLFGLTYWRRRGKTGTITKIIESASTAVIDSSMARGISIAYDNKKTGATNPMSLIERQWLRKEIHKWLELPLEDD